MISTLSIVAAHRGWEHCPSDIALEALSSLFTPCECTIQTVRMHVVVRALGTWTKRQFDVSRKTYLLHILMLSEHPSINSSMVATHPDIHSQYFL